MDILTIGYLLIALVFSGIHIGYIMKMNDNATYKYTRFMIPAIYLVGLMGYLLLLFYMSNNKEYTLHILYGILMLICLPAVLFSASVATIVGGNL
jgi:hypothetical protein